MKIFSKYFSIFQVTYVDHLKKNYTEKFILFSYEAKLRASIY